MASGSPGTVPVSALTATLATPSSRPAAIAEQGAAGAPRARPSCRKEQRGADSDGGGLERDHRLDRVPELAPPWPAEVSGEQARPIGAKAQADPLPRADPDAEPALGEPRQQEDPAGDRGLHQGEGRHRERGDVQGPAAGGDRKADRHQRDRKSPAPLRSGCLSSTRGRRHRAPVLAEQARRSWRVRRREQAICRVEPSPENLLSDRGVLRAIREDPAKRRRNVVDGFKDSVETR